MRTASVGPVSSNEKTPTILKFQDHEGPALLTTALLWIRPILCLHYRIMWNYEALVSNQVFWMPKQVQYIAQCNLLRASSQEVPVPGGKGERAKL